MYVHICTRQVLGTESPLMYIGREKGYWIDSLSLYISNCTDQEKKKKNEKKTALLYSIYFDGGGGGGGRGD